MKALIVGAGIGGLAAALACHRRGIACEIYEQSDAVSELGVGINILPNAVRELRDLGLLDRLDQAGVRTYELFYLNRLGQEIWHERRGMDAGYGARSSRSTGGTFRGSSMVRSGNGWATTPYAPAGVWCGSRSGRTGWSPSSPTGPGRS